MVSPTEFSRPIEVLKHNFRAVALSLGMMAATGGIIVGDAPPNEPKTSAQTDDLFGANVAGYDWNGSMEPTKVIEDVQRIGAHYLVFNPALYMEDGIVVDHHLKTPHLDDVRQLAKKSAEAGLPISIKPLFEVGANSGFSWRGEFIPDDPDAWFESYAKAVEAQYAAAYAEGCRTLVVGTELTNLEGEEYQKYWESLIRKFRSQYPGTSIKYDQNWDLIGNDPSFVHELDVLGYSMYPSFSEDLPVDEQWRDQASKVKQLERRTGIRREFAEFGISLTSSIVAPYQENKLEPRLTEPDPEKVIAFIGAACRASTEFNIPHALWGTYVNSWIENGIDLDARYGFNVSSSQNATLAGVISDNCS